MAVVVSMLRGVNVGPHNRIKMDALRAAYLSLGLEDPHTYVQSGNVIFRSREKSLPALAKKIQSAVDGKFGFRPEVILRTAQELRQALAANPFGKRRDVEPGKLLITFLATMPGPDADSVLDTFKNYPEEVRLHGLELYIYFPNGAGKSKLPWSSVEKRFKTAGTARNLNSVTRMLAIADEMEAAA